MQADITSIDWDCFSGAASGSRTGETPVRVDTSVAQRCFEGQRVLVTGAGGFIGSALALALASFAPAELLLLDQAETGVEQVGRELEGAGRKRAPRLIIGSITDAPLLEEIFARHTPEVVFHAAACKHVPLMEANPLAAVATNVLGTQRLCAAAALHKASQVVLLSTDKAVEPRSIMGASKRVAELIALSMSRSETRLAAKVVRLGNVLGSTGSVGPRFAEQVARGQAMTVTDPGATRYFLSLRDAVAHLLNALALEPAPALLVPELGARRSVVELARFVAEQVISQRQVTASASSLPEPEIVFTGLRPGDKLTENLVSSEEFLEPGGTASLRRVQTPLPPAHVLAEQVARLERAVSNRALPELLAAMCAVVPSFQPSRELLEAASSSDQQERHERVRL